MVEDNKCPICGNNDMWIYAGLWHCSHCPYCGNVDEEITTAGGTTPLHDKRDGE